MSGTTTPAGLLPHHWAELEASAIAPDVAAANVASFGEGTERHWEAERAELVAHDRRRIQTESLTGSGRPQWQAGELAAALIRLDCRYRHLQAGGWRSLSQGLPGLDPFDQWKPDAPRMGADRKHDKRTGRWVDVDPKLLKYETPPAFPDGGGAGIPHVPERCWRLICQRQGLPFPDAATVAAGYVAWALATPELRLLICEGWKKALAAISAGYAAVALPGVTMGIRRNPDDSRRLIPALQALTTPGRRWLICFDADAKPSTASTVAAATGALARALRAAGGRVEVAHLPLLPGTAKTGLDDLAAAAGPEALAAALADTSPRPVLPRRRPADRVAPAGAYLGNVCPIPTPEQARLVIVDAPMGCGKTTAIRDAVRLLEQRGIPVFAPYHRRALGQAGSDPERGLGVPWEPAIGSDDRRLGLAACYDSWHPNSGLRVTGHGCRGGVLVLDEWAQAVEHLLLSTGTALGKGRRAAALRTLAQQAPDYLQAIASNALMPDWAVRLLERLTGHRAYVIRSDHQPMAGRPLHAPRGLRTAGAAAKAFRVQWRALVDAGEPFLCWTSAQKGRKANAPQTLARDHMNRRPRDLVTVIDSTTRELATELAADPNGFAERRTAQARAQGGNWALYCSPAISSGLSFSWDADTRQGWRPAAVIAFAGGRVAPEHAAQALARVRCPEVPAYLFAPETCPGGALRVGSGATDPAELIRHLRAVADPLLGALEEGHAEGAYLDAWAELGALRNRQSYAYAATIAGLLQEEGWELQAQGPDPCPAVATAITDDLKAIAKAYGDAEDAAVIAAAPITTTEAATLKRRRTLEPAEQAALDRFELAQRWSLGDNPPSLELLEADRDKLRNRLRLGFLLTTAEALAMIPAHDSAAIAALDPAGRPFAPDRPRVALAPRITALQALGVPALLERFAAGETIAATDPAVVGLHALATAHRGQLAAAAGVTPGKLPTGTLRAVLHAIGWELQQAGRVKTRGAHRDAYTYRAQGVPLPEGVDAEALAAVWLAELQATVSSGAKKPPTEKPLWGEKSPADPPPPPPPPGRSPRPWPLAPVAAVPWPPAPPRPRPTGFRTAHREGVAA